MPAHTLTPSVILDRVAFSWPDGSVALSGISGSFGAGRTGLVGRNGSGKSTLLRLIAGLERWRDTLAASATRVRWEEYFAGLLVRLLQLLRCQIGWYER